MFIHRSAGLLLAACAALVTAGCAAAPGAGPSPGAGGERVAALHAAAECLRQHGVSNFADPVVGANGQVFTDTRPLESLEPRGAADAVREACRTQLGAANWNPEQQPPAPAALVAAGVRAARCLREHGLPDMHDPTASSNYTPGHGFGITGGELPPGADKGTPVVQQAFQACRSLLDAEIRASTLTELAGK